MKNLKFFLIALILSLPFWWGVNALPSLLTAQVSQLAPKTFPDLKIEGRAAISFLLDDDGKETILFEKNAHEILAIASLTKLMTAGIVLEIYDPDQIVEMAGEKFFVKDLLASMLIESNNAAATALSRVIGEEGFVDLMNLEAKHLGLENTHFANPTGLDSQDGYSTARDLTKLTKSLLRNRPLIWQILSLPEFEIRSSRGVFHHLATSTNELLGKIPSMLGGKTGETPNGQGCLLLVLKVPEKNGYLINVILGSQDRFGQMQKLIEAIKAYAQDRIIFNNTGGQSFSFLWNPGWPK